MNINHINKEVIEQIRNGSEKAFSELYSAYYSYLNAVALCYLLDKNSSAEIVNDVFVNIWNKRQTLSYPIHYYLVRSVQNGCLNYIRMQRAQQSVLDEHKDQMLAFQENYIQSTPVPLQYVEMRQTEEEIRLAVNQLPLKCRQVFEEYFYAGKEVDVIANDMGLTVSTVRVQLKNATDRLKPALKHLLFLFFY
ncbi:MULTISPECIES: RNA polymerase sigma-70 factor [Parabacteroides]|uniref:RNA polymerase sigma-70 factor n=1 Tax=Parabacteroides leei TaxID=2939491 RepID=UPI00189AA1F2|nr:MULTISPECIES: RNA polymerase sigma-70 factor [Parabacteroides]MCL3853804.1 RNA polymerase sigma-70 factor [Parabacteroides leei]